MAQYGSMPISGGRPPWVAVLPIVAERYGRAEMFPVEDIVDGCL